MGVERIGDESADADAELLAMTVECLLAAGLTEFQVSVGQVDYFKSLLKEAELGRKQKNVFVFDLAEKFFRSRRVCRRTETQRQYAESLY